MYGVMCILLTSTKKSCHAFPFHCFFLTSEMFNLPSVHIHRDTKNGQDALTVAEVGEVLDAPVRRRRKESGPSPLLKDPEDAAC